MVVWVKVERVVVELGSGLANTEPCFINIDCISMVTAGNRTYEKGTVAHKPTTRLHFAHGDVIHVVGNYHDVVELFLKAGCAHAGT